MACHRYSPRRSGFSLVELMTVVAIIGLLVAILVPAIKAARDRAKVASVMNTIRVMETGLEAFKADSVVGGNYPPSFLETSESPHPNVPDGRFSGASLVCWALAGADMLGTPGFSDFDGDGDWTNDQDELYEIVNNNPSITRVGPLINIDQMRFPVWGNRFGDDGFVIERQRAAKVMTSVCFLDAFDRPILYYRANRAATEIAWDSDTGDDVGIYDFNDNADITGRDPGDANDGLDLGAGARHFPGDDDGGANGFGDVTHPEYKGTFVHTIWNPDITVADKPHRADSYILLSAGLDGLYGTEDDLANFQVNK